MNDRCRGFTLIEMMLTVTIIGLALTVVILRIDTFIPGTRLEAACRKLVSDMEQLRLLSIMLYKQPIHLEYDREFNGYRAYIPFEFDDEQQITGPGETELVAFCPLPEGVHFENVQLGGEEETSNWDRITVLINPDGSTTGHLVIMKDDNFEKYNSIRVASLTGFAEILDHRVEYEEIGDESF